MAACCGLRLDEGRAHGRLRISSNGVTSMNIMGLVISLICGAVGGNVAGAAMKDKSLGTAGNSLAGIFGGGIGGAILQALGLAGSGGGSLDLSSVVSNIAGGGVGGAVVLAIIAAIKGAMAKR